MESLSSCASCGSDWDRLVAASGAGHGGGSGQAGDQLVGTTQRADGARADTRLAQPFFFTGKVVVEGDRAKEIGKWLAQPFGNGAQGRFGQITIPIMKGVEHGEERRFLMPPLLHEFLVEKFLI